MDVWVSTRGGLHTLLTVWMVPHLGCDASVCMWVLTHMNYLVCMRVLLAGWSACTPASFGGSCVWCRRIICDRSCAGICTSTRHWHNSGYHGHLTLCCLRKFVDLNMVQKVVRVGIENVCKCVGKARQLITCDRMHMLDAVGYRLHAFIPSPSIAASSVSRGLQMCTL